MIRRIAPPEGSRIKFEQFISGVKYSWSNAVPAGGSWAVILFLCAWMGGWYFGETTAIRHLFYAENIESPQYFLMFWLAGWTLGGLWCAFTIFLFIRPTKPSELTLENHELTYYTGLLKPRLSFDNKVKSKNRNKLPSFTGKRYVIPFSGISNIKLERIDGELKLTIDNNAKRVEIGETLSEPEKEWLCTVLQQDIHAYRGF